MNETALVVINEGKRTARDVVGALSAAIYNLLHSHTERVRLRRILQREALVVAIAVLCTVCAMRKLDVTGVNQAGRSESGLAMLAPTETEEDGLTMLAPTETVESAKEACLREQAAEIAKVLYGIRKNSERDLRAVCWVLFNRVEDPRYPDTLEEVINQSGQWVCYFDTNPSTAALTELAYEELRNYDAGINRPISEDVLWFDWSPDYIAFKAEF